MRTLYLPILTLLGLLAGCREAPGPVVSPPTSAPSAATASIEGKVALLREVPTRPAQPLPESVSRVCGNTQDDASLVVGPEKGLANAVVYLEAPAAEPPKVAPKEVVLNQQRCAYAPRVVVARAGDRLALVNSDPLLHNVRANEGARPWFNVAMPFEGLRSVKVLPARSASWEIGCDVHPWMKAWVKTFDHPWFAITGPDGRYKIENVPSGSYRLKLWHERFEGKEAALTLEQGQAATLDWTLESP